ncbi:hypothetical protein K2P97_08235 [bacterium]|nr:hypothetical protein [bacterium]
MKRVFIGHRGVGKTQLLKRHQTYFPDVVHFDLDSEIENHIGQTISFYFESYGETAFRNTEQEVFNEIVSMNSDYVVSLGAGFNVELIPQDTEIIYIIRITDPDGRVFLNRPRLEKKLSPLEEYNKRYEQRNPLFLKKAQRLYFLQEGLDESNTIEASFLKNDFAVKDAYYTLCEQDLPCVESLLKNYSQIELRTDLIKEDIIKSLLDKYPQHHWLVSVRTHTKNLFNAKFIDTDVQFNTTTAQIVSSHQDSIQNAINDLKPFIGKTHLKLSPLVNNFEDLIKGYEWQQQDATNRSFLPRSSGSKWIWFRQLAKYSQRINFIRNFTMIADQPSLHEWLALPEQKPSAWAAVLGKPVYFSRSPQEHFDFFDKRKSFFTKIDISADELHKNHKFLAQLGLKYAAVTAPLKETAFKISHNQSELSGKFKAANTLFMNQQEILADNTDYAGFRELTKNIRTTDKVAIWGGGGTLDMMKAVLPQADLFSAQSGELRSGQSCQNTEYDYLIWAAPRANTTRWPDENLKIRAIIDLNYTENSMGLELAAQRKIDYTSGLKMFKLQAQKQQVFWSSCECK